MSSNGDDGGVLPTWLPSSFTGFRNLVVGVAVSWVVTTILGIAESLIAATAAVWESLRYVGSLIGGVLEVGATSIAAGPEIALAIGRETILGLASTAGPFAPIVVILAWAVVAFVVVGMLRLVVVGARRAAGVFPFI